MSHNNEDQRKKDMGPEMRHCPAEDCHKPEEAADSAVKKVFGILGVNVDDPKQVEQFRQGLRFGEALHKYANKSIMTIVVVVTVAMVGATFAGIVYKISCIMPPSVKGG